MSFFAFLWLFSLTVLLPIVIVKMQNDTKRQQLAARQPGARGADALTVGELRELIREAVAEETAPLAERLAVLERGALPEPLREQDPGGWEEREKSVGRRTSA